MKANYPFADYPQFQAWLATTDPYDEYFFLKKPVVVSCGPQGQTITILKETTPELTKRLEYNLSFYRLYRTNPDMMECVKLPQSVHDQRAKEFQQLRNLRD